MDGVAFDGGGGVEHATESIKVEGEFVAFDRPGTGEFGIVLEEVEGVVFMEFKVFGGVVAVDVGANDAATGTTALAGSEEGDAGDK